MSFKDIIGQGKAVNILLGTMAMGRMPSAYLFAGESGIGKKFTALNLAKALNCTSPKSQVPSPQPDCCDECAPCKKINNRTHPDFLLVSPEKGEIRVDEIRQIEEALSYAPYEAKRKIVIVDDAETMNPPAANAFLKTLEEPPAQSIIILISASPDRLPETIRSRCARINFSPLSPEKCEEVIKGQAISNEPSAISYQTMSRLAMGRPGLAISSDLIEERDWFLGLLEDMAGGSNKEIWADKEEMELWFNKAFMLLRDLAVLKVTGKSDMLINIDLKERLSAISGATELKDIMDIYGRLSLLKVYLGFNLNKAITWNYAGIIIQNLKIKTGVKQ